ncbi:MAG: BatD family protein [Acidobacteriota bacterium]|nr:BatD family protein [Acidobacteriota bacterium]
MKLLTVFLFSTSAYAQVSFEVGPEEIGSNQAIQFVIKLEGTNNRQPGFPTGLDTGDFELYNQRPSYSSSISMINGKTEAMETYTYTLTPKRKGKLRFPSQTIRFKGKEYRSEETIIEVGDPVSNTRRSSDPFDGLFNNRRRGDTDLWIELETERKSYYKGEPIILTVYAYWSRGFWQRRRSYIEIPEMNDFWVEEIEVTGSSRQVTKNNRRVNQSLLAARLLYANRTGDLTIDPARLIVERFGYGSGQYESKPWTVEIKAVPTRDRPADFTGLVGEFDIQSELDQTKIKAGESVSMNVELNGLGNLALITDLKPVVPEGKFEIFDGGAPDTTRIRGVPRRKTWRYAMVPQEPGVYEVSEPGLTFFDTKAKTFKTIGGKTFTLTVEEGETLVGGTTAVNQNTIDLKQSLSYIMLDNLENLDERRNLTPPGRLVQLGGGLLTLNLVVFLALFVRNRSLSRQANMRPRFALRNYKKAVSKLRVQDDAADVFYAGLSQAILDYFGDKWERTGQGISLETIHEYFRRKDIDEALYQKVAECIEACDLARFTPSSPSSRESLMQKAGDVIASVEEVL